MASVSMVINGSLIPDTVIWTCRSSPPRTRTKPDSTAIARYEHHVRTSRYTRNALIECTKMLKR